MYLDRKDWSTFWNDNSDFNEKLWKLFAYENSLGDTSWDLGHTCIVGHEQPKSDERRC